MPNDPHRLEYETKPEISEQMGNAYHVIAGLNLFTLVCAVGLFLLMLLVSNDRMGGLLAVYLGVPFCLGHVVIAGFPAWVYLAGAERRDTNRRALSKLLVRSLLPIAIVAAGLLERVLNFRDDPAVQLVWQGSRTRAT